MPSTKESKERSATSLLGSSISFLVAAASIAATGHHTPEQIALFVNTIANGVGAILGTRFESTRNIEKAQRNSQIQLGMARALQLALKRARTEFSGDPSVQIRDEVYEIWIDLLEKAQDTSNAKLVEGIFPLELSEEQWQFLFPHLRFPEPEPSSSPQKAAEAQRERDRNDCDFLARLLRDFPAPMASGAPISILPKNLHSLLSDEDALRFAVRLLPLYRAAFAGVFSEGGAQSKAIEYGGMVLELEKLDRISRSIGQLCRGMGAMEGSIKDHVSREAATLRDQIIAIDEKIEKAVRPAIGQTVRTELRDFAYRLPALENVHGREEQMAKARDEWMASSDRRLLIYGSPGIGKSTFARSILRDDLVRERFKERRFEIQCDSLITVQDLISQMALQWFGLTEFSVERLRSILQSELNRGPSAILLDNFETLAHSKSPEARLASQQWLAQLAAIDTLWVMVAIQGRHPPDGLTWRLAFEPETLSVEAARQIFCEWSNLPSHRDDPRLDELLSEVDYVPHCAKLLGGLARDRDLEFLLRQWKKYRMKVFSELPVPRPESIRVTYAFAISHLDQSAQKDLRVLAWLPNGVADRDLEVVLPNGLEADSKLYGAALAYRKGDPFRLRMLKPLQDYVAEECPSTVEERQCARQHYLNLAILGSDLGRRRDSEILRRLGIEYPNIPPALEDGFENGIDEAIDAACGVGYFSARTGIGRDESLLRMKKASEFAGQRRDTRRKANCFKVFGDFEYVSRNFANSKNSYQQALELFREVHDLQEEANCLWQLGEVARHQNDLETAENIYNQALSLYVSLKDKAGEAWCRKGFADLAYQRGDLPEACQLIEAALSHFRAAQHTRGQAGCLWELADLARQRNDPAEAGRVFLEALKLFRETADRGGEAWCLKGLGDVALMQNADETASAHYIKALATFRAAEEKWGEAECLEALADIASKRGQLRDAHSLLIQARDGYLVEVRKDDAARIQSMLDARPLVP